MIHNIFCCVFFVLSIVYCVSGLINFKVDYFTNNNVQTNIPERCPMVKATRNFDINGITGSWYIIQYYAASDEALEYSCMRCNFSMVSDSAQVNMNFTYMYEDDPDHDELKGNITFNVPDFEMPAHWVHAEYIYEGVYNTYILDTDYTSWMLIMHCAEKAKSPRYLSALLLSREPALGINVVNYLREKLIPYDIDMQYLFEIPQENCKQSTTDDLSEPEEIKKTTIEDLIEPQDVKETTYDDDDDVI